MDNREPRAKGTMVKLLSKCLITTYLYKLLFFKVKHRLRTWKGIFAWLGEFSQYCNQSYCFSWLFDCSVFVIKIILQHQQLTLQVLIYTDSFVTLYLYLLNSPIIVKAWQRLQLTNGVQNAHYHKLTLH